MLQLREAHRCGCSRDSLVRYLPVPYHSHARAKALLLRIAIKPLLADWEAASNRLQTCSY